MRRFTSAQKAAILARAGFRCEHHHLLYGRCRREHELQADHVHPHSRGGATAIANGQALCGRHNRAKSARVPWNLELRRLARRRAAYFPHAEAPAVVRHQPYSRQDIRQRAR